jgi:antitoxin HicB
MSNVREENMEIIYPAVLTPDEGTFMVTFPDFEEAITSGATEEEALVMAADCLEEVIADRIVRREDVPSPSLLEPGMYAVFLPTLTAAKAALWMEMRRQGLRKADLAARLDWDQKQVDRLFNFHHSSKPEVIDQALRALGKRLVVSLADAA